MISKNLTVVNPSGLHLRTEITLVCDGEDEEEAMKTISQAIESGLGEM